MAVVLKISFLVLAACLHFCNAGSYTVVAGRSLRPLSEYRAAVSRGREGGVRGDALLVEVLGRNFREAQEITLEPDSTTIVSFKIGTLTPGFYNLTVRTTSGEPFQTTVPLHYENKTYSVFIHTDKTAYRPTDIIYFRLLVLNMHLKPLTGVRPLLVLKDGNGNIVRQWTSIGLTKGVFSDEVQVAEFPVLGDWKFEVELQGQLYGKKILVADFVMPKFNLNIKAPKHIYYDDETFTVRVNAQQFSGQDIMGELTVSAYPVFYSGVIQPIFQAPVRKVMDISGRADVQLAIGPELGLAGLRETGVSRRVVVEAAVEEALTGRRHNVTALVMLHGRKRAISHSAPRFYKLGLPYSLQVKASEWESSGSENLGTATVRYSFSGEGEDVNKMVETEHAFDASGRFQYTFQPDPVSNQSLMNIEIMYMDIKEKIVGIVAAYSSSENFMQVSLMTPSPAVNKELHIRVTATEPLRSITYHVLGRGDIVYAKTLQVVPAHRSEDFTIQATQAMAPEATLLAFYVSDSGQIVTSSIRFKVEGVLQNNIDINLIPQNPEPLGKMDVTVQAAPDSYIAVMAGPPSPDFSIATDHHHEAGEGDGLTMNQVLKELRSYSANSYPLHHPYEEIGGGFSGDTFEKSGVVVLTDNTINNRHPSWFQSNQMGGPPQEDSTRPPLAGPYAFSHLPPPPAPRLHLGSLPSPTWLFTNITLGAEGRVILGRRVSQEAGSEWAVGAWGVHPSKGLGLATPAMALSRFRPLKASIPRHIRAGEALAVPVTLQNEGAEAMDAEITLHNSQQEFRFEEMSNDVNSSPKLELYQRQKVSVPAGRSATVVFFISVPISTAETETVNLRMTSSGKGLSETYELPLTIIKDGEEESTQASALLNMRGGSAEGNLTLRRWISRNGRVPSKYPDETVQAGLYGSLLAPALDQLPRLLNTPPASGFHNMLPFMAATLLLHALENSGQSSEAVRVRGVEIMQHVYQQQMAYHQTDGSFSLQGHPNLPGSVWVTANTVRWLGRALSTPGAGVRATVVEAALRWLSIRQQPDGHWSEAANVALDDPQQQQDVTLTAITLQAFLDTKHLTGDEYTNLMAKAQDWLARSLGSGEGATPMGPEALAPLAAVLSMSKHPSAARATLTLAAASKISNDRRWWDVGNSGIDRSPWRGEGRGSAGVQVSAWGLQALLGEGLLSEALQVSRALLDALSTWNEPALALPALPALVSLAERLPARTNARIEMDCPTSDDKTLLSVNPQNSLFIQKQVVKSRNCTVRGEGQGVAVALLRATRRTNVTGAWPRFTLDPRVDAISTAHHLQLSVCVGFATLPGEDVSGPVLMNVRLPSGFDLDLDLPALLAGGKVRSAHVNGEGILQLVLAPLNASERCTTLRGYRSHTVANEQPGVITLVDLVDSSRRARVFFNAGTTRLCDACSVAQCGGVCGSYARQQASREGDAARSLNPTPTVAAAASLVPSVISMSCLMLTAYLAHSLSIKTLEYSDQIS